jgi:succinate dehydrogenase / fumarate reductase cytochrome b subunit
MVYAAMPLGLVVLFGFTWSFAFHFFNGIRHLAWDLGYGFDKHFATKTGFLVFALSFLIAIGVFAFIFTGHAGYLR